MSKKIVFFDIDGTLVDDKKVLPPSAKLAIQDLQRRDVEIVIATARPPFLFEDIRKELNVNTYISFNGQHVVYEDEIIYENPLNRDQLNRLYQSTISYDFPMAFVSDLEMRATVADHPYIKSSILLKDYPKVDSSFFKDEKIYQALLYCVENEEKVLTDNHKEFYFQRWHKYSCDIIPQGASKAIGIKKILNAAGVKHENSFAFGDGINDIEMLQAVGNAIAMGNSIPELKKVADYVTDHVENKGIKRALKHYKLIN